MTTTTTQSTTTESSTTSTTTTVAATPDAVPVPVFRIRARPNTQFPAIGGAFVKLYGGGINSGSTFTTSESEASQFRLALNPRAASMETSPGLGTSTADDGYSGSLVALLPSGTSPTGYLAGQLQDIPYATFFFQPRSALLNPTQSFNEETGESSDIMKDITCQRPRASTGTLSCAYKSKTSFAADTLIQNPQSVYLRLVDPAAEPYVVLLELEAVEI